MSEFAFFRFMSLGLLTDEEKVNKTEIITITEQVLESEGMECDSKIAKVSEEKMREILNEVRKRRRKKGQNAYQENEEREQENAVYAK